MYLITKRFSGCTTCNPLIFCSSRMTYSYRWLNGLKSRTTFFAPNIVTLIYLHTYYSLGKLLPDFESFQLMPPTPFHQLCNCHSWRPPFAPLFLLPDPGTCGSSAERAYSPSAHMPSQSQILKLRPWGLAAGFGNTTPMP